MSISILLDCGMSKQNIIFWSNLLLPLLVVLNKCILPTWTQKEHKKRTMKDPSFYVMNLGNCTLKESVHNTECRVGLTEGNHSEGRSQRRRLDCPSVLLLQRRLTYQSAPRHQHIQETSEPLTGVTALFLLAAVMYFTPRL